MVLSLMTSHIAPNPMTSAPIPSTVERIHELAVFGAHEFGKESTDVADYPPFKFIPKIHAIPRFERSKPVEGQVLYKWPVGGLDKR